METLFVIFAVWFILMGIYGALPMIRSPRVKAADAPRFKENPLTAHIKRLTEMRSSAPDAERPSSVGEPRPILAQPRQPAERHAQSLPTEPVSVPEFRPVPRVITQSAPTTLTSPARIAMPRRQPLAMFHGPDEGDPYAEVSMLRAQVEYLRSEINARAGTQGGEREDRGRSRRYKTGVYTELPRTLRRQVQEVRQERRPSRA